MDGTQRYSALARSLARSNLPERDDHAALQVVLGAVLVVQHDVAAQRPVALGVQERVHGRAADLGELQHVVVEHRQRRQPHGEREHVEPEPADGPGPRAGAGDRGVGGALLPMMQPQRKPPETRPYRPERHERGASVLSNVLSPFVAFRVVAVREGVGDGMGY